MLSYKLGLTASLVIWLTVLLLVFACQKIVHNAQDEMAEYNTSSYNIAGLDNQYTST